MKATCVVLDHEAISCSKCGARDQYDVLASILFNFLNPVRIWLVLLLVYIQKMPPCYKPNVLHDRSSIMGQLMNGAGWSG